ncbi:MAG: hypothetical protein ABI652_03590 [Acidobacteriota bacterium]
MSVEQIVEQLGQRRADAATTLELLDGYRQQVDEHRGALENPQAVSDYIAFFAGFVGRAVSECDRISAELPSGPRRLHVESLRQLASDSAAEQRRCLQFRDKCINRPLPQERMRPLLNDISITTRDQLTAFRDFAAAADRLATLVAEPPAPPEPRRGLDRRQLFTRLFKP